MAANGLRAIMIISRLIGGLGNQMFQYAAGRALSLRHGTSLRVDITGFRNYALHQGFELQRAFACSIQVATPEDVRGVLGWQAAPGVWRLLARPALAPFRKKGWVNEPGFDYWAGLNGAPHDSYLTGYWQSEKYFADHEAAIRTDFTFRSPLDAYNETLADSISRANSVSLHVRRGDYARNPKTLAKHGLCSLEYYRAAIAYVAERVESPQFCVFSDDIGWARENLNMAFPVRFVSHNQGAQSFVDMQLMALCKHNIIANSSFSWWGAWLNPDAGKIVIAPRQWFADGTAAEDLIPEKWIRL